MHRFPGNKNFAFTIFDDTDNSTVENVGPVYRLLDELGIRSTKSVWTLPTVKGANFHTSTLHDAKYLKWILMLQDKGFEIALHGVRNSDSIRDVVKHGLREFESRIGRPPRIHTNHFTNRDNLYWGDARLNGMAKRACYNIATLYQHSGIAHGHLQESKHYWGDICQARIDYVRNFVFNDINLDRVSPFMPYHDPMRPYVKLWFSSCEGADVTSFCDTLCEASQDRLEEERGICIMYTHFAYSFHTASGLNPRFEALMRRLAQKNGWFVPVSTLLDCLRGERHDNTIPPEQLTSLENCWVRHKLRYGAS